MTPQEFESYIFQVSQAKGLDPAELWSVWQQEGGGSLDPTMLGRTSTKYGRAIGPWQIMPFHNPPSTLEGQTNWAADYWKKGGETLEDRVKHYYGSGTPPPGHPTWQQYAASIKKRMLKAPYAKENTQMTLLSNEPIPQGGNSGILMDDSPLGNPWLMMGLGILGAQGGNPVQNIASGAMQGLQAAQNMQFRQLEMNALLAATANKMNQRTTIEKQLIAAGLTPGTPTFQRALMQYILKPNTQVNLGNQQLGTPPGKNTRWVNPKDATAGYYAVDPVTNKVQGEIEYIPGSVQATEGETKAVGALTNVRNSITAIRKLLAEGTNFAGIPGAVAEFISQPGLSNAVVRQGVKLAGFAPDENTIGAITEASKLRALIGMYISGADVPADQARQFRQFLPAPGEDPEATQYKLNSLEKMIADWEATRGQLRAAPEAVSGQELTPEDEARKARMQRYQEKWGNVIQ